MAAAFAVSALKLNPPTGTVDTLEDFPMPPAEPNPANDEVLLPPSVGEWNTPTASDFLLSPSTDGTLLPEKAPRAFDAPLVPLDGLLPNINVGMVPELADELEKPLPDAGKNNKQVFNGRYAGKG